MPAPSFADTNKTRGFIRAPHVVQVADTEGALLSVGPTVGVQDFDFVYTDQGGTNNLLPGREVTQTQSITWPRGASAATIDRKSVV